MNVCAVSDYSVDAQVHLFITLPLVVCMLSVPVVSVYTIMLLLKINKKLSQHNVCQCVNQETQTDSSLESTQEEVVQIKGATIMSEDIIRLNGGCAFSPFGFTAKSTGWSIYFQEDGNLVIYDEVKQPKWASGTYGNPSSVLIMRKNGELVIYNKNDNIVWQSNNNSSLTSDSYAEFDGKNKTLSVFSNNGNEVDILYVGGF